MRLVPEDDPAAANRGAPSGVAHLEIDREPVTILIGEARQGFSIARSPKKFVSQHSRVSLNQPKSRCKHARLVASARMVRIEAVVPQLYNIDNRFIAPGQLHNQTRRLAAFWNPDHRAELC